MKPKKIAFFGLFGQQNLGNESTLQAIIYNARRYMPDVEIKCICTGPDDVSVGYNISAFPISEPYPKRLNSKVWLELNNPVARLLRKIFIRIPMEILHWVKMVKTLKGSRMLVVAGAGLLSDYATRPLGRPYEIFKWSIIAKLCWCKLLFVSVGAGPICHPLTRWFIKSALALADYRSYRDSFSKEYIESIGFKKNSDRVYPDLAFSLPRTMIPECNKRDTPISIIGVGIKDYYGVLGQRQGGGEAKYWAFVDKLGTFVAWLLEHKYTVRVIIGDALYDSRVKQDLMELLKKRGLRYEDGQIIDEPISSVEELLSQLAATDIVVSPRFHNILLALMLCKPVVSLSYHEKFQSVMADVGLAEYCQDIDYLDVDKLVRQVMELEKNAENIKPQLEQKAEEFRRALDRQYSIIFNNL